ncbi:MAG: 2-amino-4-hydroxy-6-hydroxymethyldihydropteridine diphosphokinase [Gammaproteobacteria bacterium]|jgi:2-amino-4-hydroxy-6-hydroxymethyldihydropteridine diphosphokinase
MSVAVYVGLGSNLEREKRLRQAVAALREQFGEVELSPVYNSAAVGFDGSDFLNLVARFDSSLEIKSIVEIFHRIEDELGRDRSLPKFASRPIDLDILLYGDWIIDLPGIRTPRPEILENAFVLKPLQDIAPELQHPEAGETMAELWRRMARDAPPLDLYPLDFDD